VSETVEKYFSILNDYFGDVLDWMEKRNYSTKDEQWTAILEVYPRKLYEPILGSLYDELKKLDWTSQERYVKNSGGLKTSYIGSYYVQSIVSEHSLAFLKKTALYSDTLIMSEYIVTELLTWKIRGTGNKGTFLSIANLALNYLSIKDLFISDFDPPSKDCGT